jgi:hypothetical protein
MPDHDLNTLLGWRGRTVLDRKGETIGKLGDLYLDEATDRPAYAGVGTGLFGRHESLVPLADITERDGDLMVPYDAELVRDAPKLDPDASLDEAEQTRLAGHYHAPGPATDAAHPASGDPAAPSPASSRREPPPQPWAGAEPVEMTRSEEAVVAGTTPMRSSERVRIRKVLVTDHVTKTVPVRREEIRPEADPPPEGRVDSVRDPDR